MIVHESMEGGEDQPALVSRKSCRSAWSGSAAETAYVYAAGGTAGTNIVANNLQTGVEYLDKTTGLPSTSSSNDESYAYNYLGDPLNAYRGRDQTIINASSIAQFWDHVESRAGARRFRRVNSLATDPAPKLHLGRGNSSINAPYQESFNYNNLGDPVGEVDQTGISHSYTLNALGQTVEE